MFTTIIVQPIFNLLVLIYALIPGHNFGLAIIIFTVFIRLAMWPLVKKQLHHAKAMRALAPELKKIKAATKGDRQKESAMTMELYKEREINPFSSLGILLVQLPVLIGLYSGINRIVRNPHQIVTFSYPWVQHLSWIHTLSTDIHKFDSTLFGFINLTRSASGAAGFYWAAFALVVLSAAGQFYQSKQLLPQDKNARGLRAILSEAGKGKSADQSEVNAAVGRGTLYIIPVFVLLAGLRFAAALPLYWLVTSVVAIIQQDKILKEDVSEASGLTVTRSTVPDGTKKVVSTSSSKKQSTKPKKRRR